MLQKTKIKLLTSFQILADTPISRDALSKTRGLAWRDTVAERQKKAISSPFPRDILEQQV